MKENVVYDTYESLKSIWASVDREAESVIEEAFLEALQRYPEQSRKWVDLIDGLPQQIKFSVCTTTYTNHDKIK